MALLRLCLQDHFSSVALPFHQFIIPAFWFLSLLIFLPSSLLLSSSSLFHKLMLKPVKMPASKTLLLAALFGLAVFAKPQDGSDTDADSDSDLDTDDSGDSSSSPAPTAGGADSTSALSYPSAVVTDLTTFCSG